MNKLNIKVKLVKRLSGFKLKQEYTIEQRFVYDNISKCVVIGGCMISETSLFIHFDITENQLDKLEIFQ